VSKTEEIGLKGERKIHREQRKTKLKRMEARNEFEYLPIYTEEYFTVWNGRRLRKGGRRNVGDRMSKIYRTCGYEKRGRMRVKK
jgi:hypothetical protein